MLTEEYFSPSEAVLLNIKKLSEKQSMLCEQRICEIAELAADAVNFSEGLLEVGVDIFAGLSLIADGYPDFSFDPPGNSLDINRKRLKLMLSGMSMIDKAHFADIYTELLLKSNRSIKESDFLPSRISVETFVYVKNLYADEAYDVFSQDFNDPRVKYAWDFREAVRMVADGEVTYCILPLEEKGARLSSIAELLYRAELKINSVIPVYGMDAEADIKYALVSRHFTAPMRDKDDDRYLEIRIPSNSRLSISDILVVSESYGAKVYRVNTLTFDTGEAKREYYSVVFSGEDVDFTTLLVFLTLFVPEYTAVGIYKNLEL